MLSDVVLPGVIDAMESDGTFYRLDDVPIYFQPFTSSPFSFTESNVDTMNQIFERVKAMRRYCSQTKKGILRLQSRCSRLFWKGPILPDPIFFSMKWKMSM